MNFRKPLSARIDCSLAATFIPWWWFRFVLFRICMSRASKHYLFPLSKNEALLWSSFGSWKSVGFSCLLGHCGCMDPSRMCCALKSSWQPLNPFKLKLQTWGKPLTNMTFFSEKAACVSKAFVLFNLYLQATSTYHWMLPGFTSSSAQCHALQ